MHTIGAIIVAVNLTLSVLILAYRIYTIWPKRKAKGEPRPEMVKPGAAKESRIYKQNR